MTCLVYLMKPQGSPLCKVGHTHNLKDRRVTLQGACPMRVDVLHVIEVESRRFATACERIIRGWLPHGQSHGEWLEYGPLIHEAFQSICPAVDVSEKYATDLERRAPSGYVSLHKGRIAIAVARAEDILGHDALGEIFGRQTSQSLRIDAYHGRMTEAQIQKIEAVSLAPLVSETTQ